MIKRHRKIFCILMFIGLLSAALIKPQSIASADANLTISPITWNVVGLDSNDVQSGPNNFPAGARVCNIGDSAATNLAATFFWDDGEDLFSGDPYINLRTGSLSVITLDSLAEGTCSDFFFEVSVTRDAASYDNTRAYHINVTADDDISLSTPTPREIYVEHLVSQNRNSTDEVYLDNVLIPNGGSMTLTVGNTYEIKLVGKTATNGYEQIESFLNFPNTIFQILSVSTDYSADSSAYVDNPSDKLYGDSCLWENDPNNPNYRTCLDVGKNGGDIAVTYQVRIIGGAGSSAALNSLIYDFSGSSYHYNSDFSTTARIVNIIGPSSITITKQFVPDSIIAGSTSNLRITLTNPTASTIAGVQFDDDLPGTMVVAPTPNASTTGCGSPTFNPPAGAGSFSFSNGTLAPNSICNINLDVTVPDPGSYQNETDDLFINGTDNTGNTAEDTLTASTGDDPGCIPSDDITMASWEMGTEDNPPLATTRAGDVLTALASSGNPSRTEISAGSWSGDGWPKNAPIMSTQYFQFGIDSSNYTDVDITLDFWRSASWGGGGAGTPTIYIYSSTSASGPFQQIGSYEITSTSSASPQTVTLPADSSGLANTYFRIYATGATNQNSDLFIDNVFIKGSGCLPPQTPPTIEKTFTDDPIAVGGASRLTFTLRNTDAAAVNLTGVQFIDPLPGGLVVADLLNSGTDCVGSPTWSPNADDTTLIFGDPSGLNMIAGSSCTVWVDIKAVGAGQFNNVSGYISSAESGENTGTGGYAVASITAISPPIIAKRFSASPIFTGGTSDLSFTITNPNQSEPLSGIGFTDDLHNGVAIVSPSTSSPVCGGTLTTTNSPGTITLSGGSLDPASSCTFSVAVSGDSPGTYDNETGEVSSLEGGAGNRASDTLIVRDPNAGISLLKQVSTSPTGPWNKFIMVTAGTRIYYQFTVENIGDVPLSPISISDDLVNVSSCNNAWASFSLPVAVAANDDHIAACVVGVDEQILADSGSNTNTAQAIGIHDTIEYRSPNDEATYATPDPRLTLTKKAIETAYSAVGDTLNFEIEAVNTGIIPITGATITDASLGVLDCTPSQPIDLGPNENLVCTGTHIIEQADVGAGFYTNTATADSAQTDPVDASETVMYDNGEELSFTGVKTFDDGGVPVIQWTMDWINTSNSTALDVMVSDPIPEGSVFSRTGIESGYPVPLSAPFGSTNDGVSCVSTSQLTTTAECYYEGITPLYERGRIIWRGTLGPDFGAATPDEAEHAVSITFNVEINDGVTSMRNIGSLSADLNRDGAIIDPGETRIVEAESEWRTNSSGGSPGDNPKSAFPGNLPETGFAPRKLTNLPEQPEDRVYSAFGPLWLEIPALDVKAPIVGVPASEDGWDLTWLGNQVGWLESTAFPTWAGNSGLTAHVVDANGKPGLFANLQDLSWGDQIFVKGWGQNYIYEVRDIQKDVRPDDMSPLAHEEYPWLTLITCRGFDSNREMYRWRVVVNAVQVGIQ